MKKWIVWNALLICCAFLTTIQAQVVVRGRVIDLSGEGIPGVEVAERTTCISAVPITPVPVVCSAGAQTDANGFFQYSVPFCPSGSSCLTRTYSYTVTKAGFFFSDLLPRIDPNTGIRTREHVGIEGRPLVSVSAAAYQPATLSAGMIATTFGTGLATMTEAATTLPLPTVLAGRSVLIRGGPDGSELAAPLLFVSPTQINYIVPEGLGTSGALVVRVMDGPRPVQGSFASLERIAPGVFTANADGDGVAAANVLRVKPDGSQIYEPVAQFDATTNKFVFAPIDFDPANDQLILVLFGTGWRNRASLSGVMVSVGGLPVQVEYAGLQPTIPGLDQINARLPRDLAGRGETTVVVRIETQQANTVKLSFK